MPSFLGVRRLQLDAVLGIDIHSIGDSLAHVLVLITPWLNLIDCIQDGCRLKIYQVRLRIVTLREQHPFRLVLLSHQVSFNEAPILTRLVG